MYIPTTSLFILCTQIVVVCSSGHLFIGLLGYTNENSACCEENSCDDIAVCNVTVEVVIENTDSSLSMQSQTISDSPITLSQAETFLDGRITNPISYNFQEWPGGVNLSVIVYNGSSEFIVDQFETDITLYGPSDYYFRKTLRDVSNSSSMLSMVFRYICGATIGPPCFTDCLDHDDNETCPSKPATTPMAIDIITFTGFKDPKCESTDQEGNVILSNCTGTTASSIEPTSFPLNETNTTSPNSFLTGATTEKNETPTVAETTTLQSVQDTTSTTTTLKTTTTAKQTITTKTTKATNRNSVVETHPRSSPSTMTVSIPTLSTVYPRDGNVQSVDVNTAYWPAIVGGVLGGVALFAATAFICYWNRQKKLQKRQEIYNVNPKILRNFEEFEENGTSGRSDVPMETEQY